MNHKMHVFALMLMICWAAQSLADTNEFLFIKTEAMSDCISQKWCANDIGKLDSTADIYYATIQYKKDTSDYGPKLYVYKKVKNGYQLIAHSLSLNPHERVSWFTKIEGKSIFLGLENHDNTGSHLEIFKFKLIHNQIRLIGIEDIGISGIFDICDYSHKSVNFLTSRVEHSKTVNKGAMALNDSDNEFSPNTNCKVKPLRKTRKAFSFKSPKIWKLEAFSYDYEPSNTVDFHHWYIHDRKVCGYINDINKYDTEYCEK